MLDNPVHFTFSRSPVLREFLGHARGLIDAAEPSATVIAGVQQRLKAMRLYGTFRADGQSAHHTLAGIDNVIIVDQDLSRCLIHLAEAGKIYEGSQRVYSGGVKAFQFQRDTTEMRVCIPQILAANINPSRFFRV